MWENSLKGAAEKSSLNSLQATVHTSKLIVMACLKTLWLQNLEYTGKRLSYIIPVTKMQVCTRTFLS